MTLLEALVQRLRDLGVLSVYALNSPDDRDLTVTLRPYMGEVIPGDQGVLGDDQYIQYFTRGEPKKYPDAEGLAWGAYRLVLQIHESRGHIVGYLTMLPIQPPTYLGEDEKGRPLFSFNVPYRRIG